jgi:hypothetical protein
MTYRFEKGTRARLAGVLAFALTMAGCESEPACDDVSTVYAGDVRIREGAAELPEQLTCAEVVTGDLVILGSALRSLAGLGRLRHVQGDIVIVGNDELESLAGLDSLQRVDGTVEIALDPKLRDMDGLGSLRHIGKSLMITDLDRLESLAPLELPKSLEVRQTAAVGGDVVLKSLDALETLEGLAIDTIGGSLEISYIPQLREVDSLLGGLSLNGSLAIRGNDSLTEIGVLPGMRVSGDAPARPTSSARADVEQCSNELPSLEIAYNERLERVATTGSEFSGCVLVHDNPLLRALSLGFRDVSELQSLELDELPSLDEFNLGIGPTSSPLVVHGRLTLDRLGVSNLATLDRVVRVGCALFVSDNPELEELLPALRAANRVWVVDNERLDTCELEMWSADLEPVLPSDACSDASQYPDVRVELSGNGGAACESD